MGVTMFLTLDAIHATLATMAQCRPGTRVVLSDSRPPAALASGTASIAASLAGLAVGWAIRSSVGSSPVR
jgi:hypothetical protein